jgi:hypothetical protein
MSKVRWIGGVLTTLAILAGAPERAFAAAPSKSIVDARGARVEVIEDVPLGGGGPFRSLSSLRARVTTCTSPYKAAWPVPSSLKASLSFVSVGPTSPRIPCMVDRRLTSPLRSQTDPRLDPSRMVVAGKSLGSIVSFAGSCSDTARWAIANAGLHVTAVSRQVG